MPSEADRRFGGRNLQCVDSEAPPDDGLAVAGALEGLAVVLDPSAQLSAEDLADVPSCVGANVTPRMTPQQSCREDAQSSIGAVFTPRMTPQPSIGAAYTPQQSNMADTASSFSARLVTPATPSSWKPAASGTSKVTTLVHGFPQVIGGIHVYAEDWGMSHQQVAELLRKLRSEATWQKDNSVYDLVSKFVIPWTAGKGVGWALLQNTKKPLRANVMVSHTWAENAEEFLETVLRSSNPEDVMFICALSVYQAEDGAGPSIQEQLGTDPMHTPFGRVIGSLRMQSDTKRIKSRWRPYVRVLPQVLLIISMVLLLTPCFVGHCVPSFTQCAALVWESEDDVYGTWKWGPLPRLYAACLGLGSMFFFSAVAIWLLLPWTRRIFKNSGERMMAVPNRSVDLYSRLWCVYEIFLATSFQIHVELAQTLASSGSSRSSQAQCKCDEDMRRIRRSIEDDNGEKGYYLIDRAVFWVTRNDQVAIVCLFIRINCVCCLTSVARIGMRNVLDQREMAGYLLGYFIGQAVGVYFAYRTLKRRGGVVSTGESLCAAIKIWFIGCCGFATGMFNTSDEFPLITLRGLSWSFGFATTVSSMYVVCLMLGGIMLGGWPSKKAMLLLDAVIPTSWTLFTVWWVPTSDPMSLQLEELYPELVYRLLQWANMYIMALFVSGGLRAWGARVFCRGRPHDEEAETPIVTRRFSQTVHSLIWS